MARHCWMLWVVECALLASAACAEIAVSLRAADVTGNLIDGPVAAGSQLRIEVRLSASGADAPIAEVRDFILDFSATSETIELISFEWLVDPTAYAFQGNTLPSPSAATVFLQPGPGLLSLTDASELIGELTVSVAASGTVDAITGDPSAGFGGAAFNAGFEDPREFSVANGLVTGGLISITVSGSPPADPTDTDGDGVSNDDDAFPDDPDEFADSDDDGVGNNGDAFPDNPDETTDTDDNGIGDNADPDDDGDGVTDEEDAFPQDPDRTDPDDNGGDGDANNGEDDDDGDGAATSGLCGLGMLGAFTMTFLSLGAWKWHRRKS